MRRLLSSLLIISVLGLLVQGANAQSNRATLSISNFFDNEVCEVYIAQETDEYWGENQLKVSASIRPNETLYWNLPVGTYDIRLVDCAGVVLVTVFSAYLYQDYALVASSELVSAIEANNLGVSASNRSQYEEALFRFEQALTIYRQLGNRDGEATTLNHLGLTYHLIEQYAQSQEAYYQALDISRETGNRIIEGVALNGLGVVLDAQGQYEDALLLQDQALAINRYFGDESSEGGTLNDIAGILSSLGQYDRALDNYEQSLDITRRLEETSNEGTILNNMGTVYWMDGNQEQALSYYLQALDIFIKTNNRDAEGTVYHNIANVYRRDRAYEQAFYYYDKAMTIRREVGDRLGEVFTLNDRGLAYERDLQLQEAIDDYRESVEIIEETIQNAELDSAITGLMTKVENFWPYDRLSVLLVAVGDPYTAFEYAERKRGILVRTELANGIIDTRAAASNDLLQEELDLRSRLAEALQLLDTLALDLDTSPYENQVAGQQVDTLRLEYERFLDRLQLQGGFLTRQIFFDIPSLEEIQNTLPDDTTLLVYSLGFSEVTDPDSAVFVITNHTFRATILDVDSHQISREALSLKNVGNERLNIASLQVFYGWLVAPILSQISTSKLIISPDGAAATLPFAAMQSPDGKYLIDDFTISQVTSATSLSLLSNRQYPEPTSAALVLAQPDAPGFYHLANAQREVKAVASFFGVEANVDASESDLVLNVKGKRVIYVAAHVELNPTSSLFNAIYLRQDGAKDGRLEVHEIYELELSYGTELVVLSGCETALGGTGQEFGAFVRAFQAAGTPRVVASLWAVDDAATADLMIEFITRRPKYVSYADALRGAMLAMREYNPEPYYWASFVLNGLP